jgi:hypothetical protein
VHIHIKKIYKRLSVRSRPQLLGSILREVILEKRGLTQKGRHRVVCTV